MRQLIFGFLVFLISLVGVSFFPLEVSAQSLGQYSLATVTEVVEQSQVEIEGTSFFTQTVAVTLKDSGKTVEITAGSEFQPLRESQLLKVGTQVIVSPQQMAEGQVEYIILDVYRLPTLLFLFAGFIILVLLVAHVRGLFSLAGMVISGAILFGFMLPQILNGADPALISLLGAVAIGAVTVYLSHGVNIKSHLALGAIVLTLLAVTLLSSISVRFSQLVGLGSEEAFFLQYGPTASINLQGLLLGGIIIGALGVLDDIVVSQISVVEQLKLANKKLGFDELYSRSLEVGKDHVASLVNTLVLAYAGANLPLFLLFYLSQDIPLWVTINNQLIAEEIVRTLVGSIGLVLAVPFATLLGAYFSPRFSEATRQSSHGHRH
ncbi:MAG TPA: YibE/F family protein [Patescibacteria group bacterium]